jgi:hypothetical protein
MKWHQVFLSLTIIGFTVGCGSNLPPAPKAEDVTFKGTTADDKAKAQEFLKKEGIDGEIVGLIKKDNVMSVDVTKKAAPGKRANPQPPTTYIIDTNTGKVKKEL